MKRSTGLPVERVARLPRGFGRAHASTGRCGAFNGCHGRRRDQAGKKYDRGCSWGRAGRVAHAAGGPTAAAEIRFGMARPLADLKSKILKAQFDRRQWVRTQAPRTALWAASDAPQKLVSGQRATTHGHITIIERATQSVRSDPIAHVVRRSCRDSEHGKLQQQDSQARGHGFVRPTLKEGKANKTCSSSARVRRSVGRGISCRD